ncbi:MAG: hypothetical protein ABJF10_16605 [Chthoniobacter sp.]|uniref:hypothetical protein n=1 Tax=Chthoniobacter sp. TaxID=2510640 RepID=UPI0032A747BE
MRLINVCKATPTSAVDSEGLAKILELFSVSKQGYKLTPAAADRIAWSSPAGLIYGSASNTKEGHRIMHVLAHTVVDYKVGPGITHSVFTGARDELFQLLDEAWSSTAKVHPLNDQGFEIANQWVVPMGRVIGTDGQQKIFLVMRRAGSAEILTAHPIH